LDDLVVDLELTVRSLNCLRNAGIVKISDLVQHTHKDLLRIYNFGRRSLNDVVAELGRHGWALQKATPNEELKVELAKAYAEIERLRSINLARIISVDK